MFALIAAISAAGPMRGAPPMFVGSALDAMATTTMDFMLRDPAQAEDYREWGFAAMWSALTATDAATGVQA